MSGVFGIVVLLVIVSRCEQRDRPVATESADARVWSVVRPRVVAARVGCPEVRGVERQLWVVGHGVVVIELEAGPVGLIAELSVVVNGLPADPARRIRLYAQGVELAMELLVPAV